MFRKKKHRSMPIVHQDNVLITQYIPIASDEDGTTKIVCKTVDVLDVKNNPLPEKEVLDVERQLKAGVSIKEIDVAHMLDSQDPANLADISISASSSIINSLNENDNANPTD